MNFIQRTMLLFERLVERIRRIGDLLSDSTTSVNEDNDRKPFTGFWIFNW